MPNKATDEGSGTCCTTKPYMLIPPKFCSFRLIVEPAGNDFLKMV